MNTLQGLLSGAAMDKVELGDVLQVLAESDCASAAGKRARAPFFLRVGQWRSRQVAAARAPLFA